ncbi:MAG: hypothetical protein WEB89_06265 [Balneolales bacterium]
MKLFVSITYVAFFVIMAACASSKESKGNSDNGKLPESLLPEDTITATSPPDENYNTGSVFVDSVSKMEHNGELLLKITGRLPDGCSKLYDVNYTINENELHLSLKSWRPSDVMCTQALVDFTYISEPTDGLELVDVAHYIIDGVKKELELTNL